MRLAPLCLLLVPWLAGAASSASPALFPYASPRFQGPEHEELLVPFFLPSRDEPKRNTASVALEQCVRAGPLPGGWTPEEQALLREVEALSRVRPTGRWYTATFRERPTHPEQLTVPEYLTDLLALSSATLSPTPGPGPRAPRPPPKTGRHTTRSHLRVLEGSATAPRKVYFTWDSHSGDRWSEDTTGHVLAVFERGQLTRVVEWRRVSTWNDNPSDAFSAAAPSFSALVLVPTWREGKVWRVARRMLFVRAGDLVRREDTGLVLRTSIFEAQAR